MPYIVTFGDDNYSVSVSLVAEAPETLEEGQYYTEVELDEETGVGRFVLESGTVRQMTVAEFEAENTRLLTLSAEADNRRSRDFRLSVCDWVVVKASELGEAVPAEWATYRQALRDITTHANWPMLEEADWPVSP